MCQGSEELSRRASKTCSRCVAPHVRMELMRRRSHAVLVLLAWLPCAAPVATQVTGRLRWVGGSVPVLSWQRELEVARRENGRWRLYGYQQ